MSSALLGGLGLVALFCVLRTALEVARVDAGAAIDGPQALLASPALRDGGRWVASGLGAVMILLVLLPSTWISQALFGTPVFDLTGPRRTASDSGLEPRVIKRSSGRRRMEVELAKAARDLCEVSIALVGGGVFNPLTRQYSDNVVVFAAEGSG